MRNTIKEQRIPLNQATPFISLVNLRSKDCPLKVLFNMFDFVPIVGLVVLSTAGASATALSAYNVDPNTLSISGLSSGRFMSVQLGVAYSDTFNVGFGVFAGGPYDCARDQSVRFLHFSMRLIGILSDVLTPYSILCACTMRARLLPPQHPT